TIWIDTDLGRLQVVWRGLTGIDLTSAQIGTLVVAIESKGREIRYKQIENLLRAGALASLGTDDLVMAEPNPLSVRHDSVKPARVLASGPPAVSDAGGTTPARDASEVAWRDVSGHQAPDSPPPREPANGEDVACPPKDRS